MATLITGGSGFVGLNLAEHLLRAGEEVVLFGHTPPPAAALADFAAFPGGFVVQVGDVRSAADVDRAFTAAMVDRVVHAAAVTANLERERADPRAIMDVNVIGAIEVMDAMRRHNVRRAVVASSVAVYGFPELAPGQLCDESSVCPAPATLYGISKLASERTALRLAELHDLSVTVARIGPVFGPWEYHSGVREVLSPQWSSVDLARSGGIVILSRPAIGDWLYARDAAAGLVALLDAPRLAHEIYNVGSGVSWSLRDWVDGLAARIPGFAHNGEPGPHVSPTVRVQTARDRPAMSIERITRDTNYSPRFGLEEGLADYLAWLDDHPTFPGGV